MTTVNHEVYVSLEVAKLLKETGFDWECSSLYTSSEGFKHLLHDTIDWDYGDVDWNNVTRKKTSYMGIKGWEGGYSAPTLDVTQRWLRENKDFDINVLTDFDSVKRLYYVRYVVKDGHYKTYYITKNQSYVYFNTYEEAQEAGIKKALELILEKEEEE